MDLGKPKSGAPVRKQVNKLTKKRNYLKQWS